MQYNIIDSSYYAMDYIPVTNLFCNWKFVYIFVYFQLPIPISSPTIE